MHTHHIPGLHISHNLLYHTWGLPFAPMPSLLTTHQALFPRALYLGSGISFLYPHLLCIFLFCAFTPSGTCMLRGLPHPFPQASGLQGGTSTHSRASRCLSFPFCPSFPCSPRCISTPSEASPFSRGGSFNAQVRSCLVLCALCFKSRTKFGICSSRERKKRILFFTRETDSS